MRYVQMLLRVGKHWHNALYTTLRIEVFWCAYEARDGRRWYSNPQAPSEWFFEDASEHNGWRAYRSPHTGRLWFCSEESRTYLFTNRIFGPRGALPDLERRWDTAAAYAASRHLKVQVDILAGKLY